MKLHRVRRIATTLISSQLRSGRSSSDPASVLGRPELILVIDAVLFVAAMVVATGIVRATALPQHVLAAVGEVWLPFVPLVSVGVVLVAGLMFELTATAKFAGSDSANWLPISPFEYILASVTAISYTYSPTVAILLGGLLPLALLGGIGPLYAATFGFAIVALFMGATLVEMMRAETQHADTVSAGRSGQRSFVLRAVVLILVILLLQFAFNPVFLFGIAQRLSLVAVVTVLVPFFWSTEALSLWAIGNNGAANGFAAAQIVFVALLFYFATDLRERYWVPTTTEVRLEAHRYATSNPVLALFGLNAAESALAGKDLKGLVRRREMLPTLVIPIALIVLVLVEGGTLGGLVSVLWIGWVAGFFALVLGATSVGQERKAVQSLYAFPLSAENVLRAKVAYVLAPSLTVALGLAVLVGLFFHLSVGTFLGVTLLVVAAAVVLTFWGLAFAARFSDFQERPRPQFLRPAGMLAATGSGIALLFGMLVTGSIALLSPSSASLSLGLVAAALAVVTGAVAVLWTRAGFRQLFRELPF
ncbi:MAG TPA: hypothetical protein VEJ85_01325 [Thermoplasmata archaeon]|nr:hypothetical protein [Thermoplasmata archaeon]